VGNRAHIVLWDLAKKKSIARLEGHNYGILALAFSADGKKLASASIAVNLNKQFLPGQVILWDVAKAQKIREIKHDSSYVVLSQDGALAAWAPGKGNQVILADVHTERKFVSIPGEHHSFLFSPDNKTLVSGNQRGTIMFWDAATGKERHSLDGHVGQSNRVLGFSRDGSFLATGSWDRGFWSGSGHLRIWDVKNNKEINPVPVHADRITCVAYSPDGKVIASGSNDKSVRLWDAATGKQLHLLSGHEGKITSLVFAADGKTLASAAADKSVRLWDIGTGKEKTLHADLPAAVLALAFTPDGKSLVGVAGDGTVISWQGDESKTLKLLEKDVTLKLAALAPDARIMAGQIMTNRFDNSPNTVTLWQLPYGKPLGTIQIPFKGEEFGIGMHCWTATLSADGRYLATSESLETQGLRLILSNHTLRVWEVATNKEVLKIPGLPTGAHSLAFSPDGRFLFSAHGEIFGFRGGFDKSTLVWDAATGRRFATLAERNGPVSSGAFSPNGKNLVTGNSDYTLLSWDFARLNRPAFPPVGPDLPDRLDKAELKKAWEDLAGVDAPLAYQTVAAMTSAARDSVPFLAKQLRPVPPVQRKRIEPLIADLNSESFVVRAKASRELESMGEITEFALRQALTRKGSLEYKRRIENLLSKLNQAPTGEQLRIIRALTVLERINNDACRKLLQTLAGGAPEGRLTREARGVLLRKP
jgi:WD40 repeat protein